MNSVVIGVLWFRQIGPQLYLRLLRHPIARRASLLNAAGNRCDEPRDLFCGFKINISDELGFSGLVWIEHLQ